MYITNKLLKYFDVLEKFPHKNIYDIDDVDGRLTGGADSRANNGLHEGNPNTVNSDQLCITIMESGGNPESNRNNHQQIPEHEEVDGILKNAIQNIQEASNSLMTLTETHEHELKTLFATILAKLQRFINVIQERLRITKNVLNSLQLKLAVKFMELQTKNYELIQIRNELAQCREEALKFTINEPQLPTQISTASTRTLQTINGPIAHASKETIVQTSSPQKMTIFTVSSSYQRKGNESSPEQTATSHSVIVTVEPPTEMPTNQNNDFPQQVSIQSITNPSTTSNINAIKHSAHNLSPQLLPETNSASPLQNVVSQSANSQSEIPETLSATENVHVRIPVTSSTSQSRQGIIPEIRSANHQTNSARTIVNQERPSTSNNLVTTIQDTNTVVQSQRSPVVIEKPSSYRPSGSCMESLKPTIPEAKLASSSGVKQPSQQKEIKKDEREAQLLAKIEEMCRENEQLKKDKLEYEQAVQKALYKGLSSLNSEAIKILPNLPLICYQPCYMPCPYLPSSASSMFSEMMDGNKYVQAKSNISSKGKTQLRKQKKYFESYRPTQMCSQSNMIFILPKKTLDNAYITVPQFHINENNVKTRKTVCYGGSCNKEAFKVHKHFDAIIGNELCKGNFQEYTEAIGCSNIVNSSRMNKPQKLRHCTGFAKSKRFINN
ncbi:uncharacterized protein [Chelonus insularis]|uniref:uncharacterized protein n=1 Tax=Chelonus insularis TaxID=460826 RepID=UPI00158D241E|nr:uncharacterized protein LOC118065506 [Chelonus insularis]